MPLKLLIHCNLILFQITGICSFYYDHTNNRWSSSRLLSTYSILVFILQSYMILSGIVVVLDDISKANPSMTMYVITLTTLSNFVVTLVVVYTFQLKNTTLFIELANDLKFIYEQIALLCDQSDHRSLLIILVKTTLNVSLYFSTTMIEVKTLSSSSSSSVMQKEIKIQIFYFCRNFGLMMLPSMFYCAVLFLEHTVKQFNLALLKIVADSSALNSKDDAPESRKIYYKMLQSCDLSDRIESMAIIFSSLHKSTVKLNKIFNAQLLASNCSIITALLLKLYLIFLTITRINSSNYSTIIIGSFEGLFDQFLYLYGMYLIAATCSNISNEVN